MKIIAINPIPFKKRMIEFLFDYLFILAYLVLLFLSSMLIYIIFFNGVPEFTEIQSHWLVSFTSVLPITLLFTSWIIIMMAVLGRLKQDLNLSTRKKQCRLAWLEMSSNFYLGNSVIWARFMAYIVILICYPLSSRFQRLYLQFCYWQWRCFGKIRGILET